MLLLRTFCVSLVLVIATVASQARATPDPYRIFSHARAYWLTQHYPQKLKVTVAVSVLEGGHRRVEHYSARYDARTGVITVDPVSDYERAHPMLPTGVDVYFLKWQLNKPLPLIDFLGVPHLAPNYSFGMAPFVPAPTPTPFNSAALVTQIREEFHDPNPRAAPTPAPRADDGLKQIAVVVARNGDYAITLLGTAAIDGHPCYHLGLKPLRDPGKNRIRQAWIDEKTYAPWQLLDALNFRSGPGMHVPWMIHFADIDGAHYISEEDAQAPISAGGLIYVKSAVRFEGIHPVDRFTWRPHIVRDSGISLDEPPWPGQTGGSH